MKVVEQFAGFPQATPQLKGLVLEAHHLLGSVSSDKPVLVVSPEGANVAALKRAFAAAAKARGGSVTARNGENGTVLVRYSATQVRGSRTYTPRPEHSEAAIEAEMMRLYVGGGNKEADFDKLSSDARRKLSISAKRNLSRRANF